MTKNELITPPRPREGLKEIQVGLEPHQKTKIGAFLEPQIEGTLIQILRENWDAFAWSSANMPSIDPNLLCHQLSIATGVCPVNKKKIQLGEEKKRVVKAEIARLLQADYTDLNKACPKDSYPLPNINALVDGAFGCSLLSFMDAYSGYNQIWMHPCDESKTAFMMNEGNFCYKVIPFGLKNARATYQRLMDHIFKDHIGNQVEVYVDDMVLKLNPKKFSFGVRASNFLGFMLTQRGIEENPEKCQAVINMRSLGNVKEVQRLTGRITTLSHFLSRLAENFPRAQGNVIDSSHFDWPKTGKPIYLYISISDTTVSSMIVQEEEGEQRPIYYVSKALQGVDQRYQKIEKAILAIINTMRRLRPYFQSHPMVCRTNLPIQKILQKLDLVGRMTRWAVELSEFEVMYERRGHMRAQVLADFVNELSLNIAEKEISTKKGEWTLLVDGSSNKKGSKARIIIEGPGRLIIEQSVCFGFRASNNQAEYEALLARIRLAKELETVRLTIKSDSQLITGQVNGEYQARDLQLIQYLEVVKE
ncbi:Retrovirus-related Pol polyprotein from transposon opus, partial [Mucuna pruriens]